ncbi:hypothetical protein BDQ17DRAFT_1285590 [Cyathus striatus]|nr:hypothetical protein BDQ17DRAFT_1285590 [Cyathus striatus]
MEVTLDNTLGAVLLGAMAACMLFGITTLQMYVYYQTYPNDWRFQKIAVAALWFLDTLHLALTIHAVYHYLVTSFGNAAAQLTIVWSFKLQIAVNVVIVLLVQSLYALRVWKLGHHFGRVWPMVVFAFVAGGYAIGIILAVKTYGIDTFAGIHEMSWSIITSFATSTAIDIVIATVLCFYLNSSRSSFINTNYRILTIMKYVLASGFLTSACSLTALITYTLMPTNLVFLGIEFLLTKLYINSFVAMLNARRTVREMDSSSNSANVSKVMNLRSLRSDGRDESIAMRSPTADDDKDFIHLDPLPYRFGVQRQKSLGEKNPHGRSIEVRWDLLLL